jgi:hypothetical protein
MAGRKRTCVWDKLDAEQKEVGERIRQFFPANVESDVIGDAVIYGGALQLIPEGFRWQCLFPGCRRPALNGQPIPDAGIFTTKQLKDHWRKAHKQKVCTRRLSGIYAVGVAKSAIVGRQHSQAG